MATYVHHFEDAGATLGGENAEKIVPLNATAKERSYVSHVMAVAKKIPVGNCKECGGTGRRICDVCSGTGEVER
jgi:hypothetical protein